MDRNACGLFGRDSLFVALRKESVDRNDTEVGIPNTNTVALRKESVDRNAGAAMQQGNLPYKVALRKESVDRNSLHTETIRKTQRRSPQGERG